MPELPEVQTVVDGLNASVLCSKIEQIDVFNKKTLKDADKEQLIGKKISKIHRLGKYIIFYLDNVFLIVHLRMTGQFFFFKGRDFTIGPYDRVSFKLSCGQLVFKDVRKFGTMQVTDSLDELHKKLGIDPLDEKFNYDYLYSICQTRHKCIKAILLDQSLIAGCGNIYADEALYLAKILPMRICSTLKAIEVDALACSLKSILKKAIKMGGTSLGEGLGNYQHINGRGRHQEFLHVYGRHQQMCPICHHKLIKSKVASRGTTFCNHCQK